MKTKLTTVAVIAILAWATIPANATPVTWTVQNMSFLDGTQVTGSFVYEADTNTYSSVNLTTSGGTSVPAGNSWLIGANPGYNFDDGFVAVDSTAGDLKGAHALWLFSNLPMTNAGGLIPIDLYGLVGTCGNAQCTFVRADLNYSYWADGGAFVSRGQVPEPGSIMLLGSGLFGLAGVIRRKLHR